MCEHCEKYRPILENESALVFMVGNRLILQDKTDPCVSPDFILPQGPSGELTVSYPSSWVAMDIDRCPFCHMELKFPRATDDKSNPR